MNTVDRKNQKIQWKKEKHLHCNNKKTCSYLGCVCSCYKCSKALCEKVGHEFIDKKCTTYTYKICISCGHKKYK